MPLAVNVLKAPSAETDLDGIAAYYKPRNPVATLAMLDRIAAVEFALREHPFLGHAGRVAGTREFVVNKTPFVLVYTVGRDNITILRVIDTRTDWPQH